MDSCLCRSVHLLAKNFEENRGKSLVSALNRHLADLRLVLAQSKSISRDIQYRIIPTNERKNRVLFIDSLNLPPVDRICDRFKNDNYGFWGASDDDVHAALRRRLACVVIYLRSKLQPHELVPSGLADIFQGQQNFAEVRNSGKKYIKIARKLGGLGSILWLPSDIAASTYERYLNMDDEDVFRHLGSLNPHVDHYTDIVQQLILSQLRDPALKVSYYNLYAEYTEIIPFSDQLLLLLYALGGTNIPDVILSGIHFTQRRWSAEGEIKTISASEIGLHAELISVLSDDSEVLRIMVDAGVIKDTLEDNSITWSLHADLKSFFSRELQYPTVDALGTTVLKLICFACPPCYEGNTDWSAPLKKAVWHLLEGAIGVYKVPNSLKPQVLEALLYFSERDSMAIRRVAVQKAGSFLRKDMPYYLHASVVLFRSIVYRLDGEFAKSEAQIRDFEWKGPKPASCRDHAIQGRLHISQVENKIRCDDRDVPSVVYQWEAREPPSSLEMEVVFRLQSTAARYFQSIGDFDAAKDSLEQFLSLNMTRPIRATSRRVLVGRLADMYCETQEYTKALEVLQTEIEGIDEANRHRRGYRKLLVAMVEAQIGLGNLDDAEQMLIEPAIAYPLELDDIHDQQLYMRRQFAVARIAHMRLESHEAVRLWRLALQDVEKMYTLGSHTGFTAAVIHLSLAHAQLLTGDIEGSQRSWIEGQEILKKKKCEFSIPVVATTWLQMVTTKVHEAQGWSLRVMLPGGKPDITLS